MPDGHAPQWIYADFLRKGTQLRAGGMSAWVVCDAPEMVRMSVNEYDLGDLGPVDPDQPGWQASVLRLVDVFIDGLRVRPDRPRSKTKQTGVRVR